MNKRGALHPLMDPFLMDANRPILPDYREDMCPFTLDVLAKVVYINVNPDWTSNDMDSLVTKIRQAVSK